MHRRSRSFGTWVRCAAGAVALLAMTSVSPSAQKAVIDKDLEKAISARQRAVDTGDSAAWAKLTSDDFVSVIDNGRIRTKAERMSEMTMRNAQAASTAVDSVRMTSTDSAVIVQHDGKDEQRVMMVWVKSADSWKCVAAANVPMKR
jgi:hypothetical protein